MTAKPSARPPIILSETDAERLSDLASQYEQRLPQVSQLLLQEIARATVRADDKVAHDVVGMNATVAFIDEAHGNERTVKLVYPTEADIAEGRISILTPVGAGLIGLKAGQSILWPDRSGQARELRIVRVTRAGLSSKAQSVTAA